MIWDATNNNIYALYIKHFAILFDEFTNLICVIMSFKFYPSIYQLFCSKVDRTLQRILSGSKAQRQSIKSVTEQQLAITTPTPNTPHTPHTPHKSDDKSNDKSDDNSQSQQHYIE